MKEIRIIIAIFFIIMLFYSATAIAEKPVFDVVICADTTRINPGETLTFWIYFTGVENVTEDFLLVYMNGDIYVKNTTLLGKTYTKGLADQGTNAQLFPINIVPQVKPPDGYALGVLHPLYARDQNGSGITVTIATTNSTPPGEHDLKVIYLYKGEDGVWQKTQDIVTFHVTTEAEQIEFETLKLSLIEPYLAIFGALISALIVFVLTIYINKRMEKNRKREYEKKLLQMIKDEIEFNLDKVKQIKEESRHDVIPSYRAKTDNKEACWTNIIEYRQEKTELIEDISKLYFKYDFLNRTIDTHVQYVSSGAIVKDFHKELKRICGEVEKSSRKLITNLKSTL